MEKYIGDCINCGQPIYSDKEDLSKGTYFYHKFEGFKGHITVDMYCRSFWNKNAQATLATKDVITLLRARRARK